jgi:hypothetical protein
MASIALLTAVAIAAGVGVPAGNVRIYLRLTTRVPSKSVLGVSVKGPVVDAMIVVVVVAVMAPVVPPPNAPVTSPAVRPVMVMTRV